MSRAIKFAHLSTITLISLNVFSQNSNKNPNVIIIMADDIGYGDLDWLDSKTINTPNISKLAKEGVCLTNAYATSATSTPSRYGILTGMYPWRKQGTGIATGDAAMIIQPNQFTMADMFQQVGYKTGAIGKWHLGLGNETGKQSWNKHISPALADIGFDYSFIMAATGDRVPCVYIENGNVVGLDPSDPIEVSYTKPIEGEPTGKNNPELLRIHPSHGHDQSIVNGISRIGYMKGGNSARWVDEDIADVITAKALDFISDNKETPFFLYVGTHDIHVPRVPHHRFVGKSGMGPRGDAILSFDYCVGRLMKTLDSLGIADNTMIILTSDNGPIIDDGYKDQAFELLGNHKPSAEMRGGKYSSFQAGTKVPFIVRWPLGATKSTTSNAKISQVDLLATLAQIVHAEIPKTGANDSQKLKNVLLGKSHNGRKYIIQQNVFNTLSIIKGNYKYTQPSNYAPYSDLTRTEYGSDKKPQLYNLKNDPQEKKNLAETKKRKTEKLKKVIEKEKSKQEN